jgi:hypothetical protein
MSVAYRLSSLFASIISELSLKTLEYFSVLSTIIMARTRSTPAPDFKNAILSTEAQDSSGANMASLAGYTIEVTTTVPGTRRSGTP